MRQVSTILVLATAALAAAALAAPPKAPTYGRLEAKKSIVYSAQDNSFVATGGVTATTSDGVLTADKMQGSIQYRKQDESYELKSLEATGSVKVDLEFTGSDKKLRRVKAQSDSATYDAAARTVVLSGHVKGNAVEVATGSTIDLQGNKATLHLLESRYVIEGSPSVITLTEPQPPVETAPK